MEGDRPVRKPPAQRHRINATKPRILFIVLDFIGAEELSGTTHVHFVVTEQSSMMISSPRDVESSDSSLLEILLELDGSKERVEFRGVII